jgi:hypothetical protein
MIAGGADRGLAGGSIAVSVWSWDGGRAAVPLADVVDKSPRHQAVSGPGGGHGGPALVPAGSAAEPSGAWLSGSVPLTG